MYSVFLDLSIFDPVNSFRLFWRSGGEILSFFNHGIRPEYSSIFSRIQHFGFFFRKLRFLIEFILQMRIKHASAVDLFCNYGKTVQCFGTIDWLTRKKTVMSVQ